MLDLLKMESARYGDRASVMPIYRLQDIRADLEQLKGSIHLNSFQQYILSNLYKLDVPDDGFVARSIIMVASPSPATIEFKFHWQGIETPLVLPASYVDKDKAPLRVEQYLKAFLNPMGHDVLYAAQLPRKRIAVRSGLAAYGRNNICYVDGMGSFVNLSPFFSDIPCEVHTWRDVCQMELCQTCHICLDRCPTGAILPDRFLIDNERCLTYFNEVGSEWGFPDWMDPSAHHTLYGCLRCQEACPKNRQHLLAVRAPVEFSEEETGFLLEGKPLDALPENLREKLEMFEMVEYLGALPRNLRRICRRLRKKPSAYNLLHVENQRSVLTRELEMRLVENQVH